MKHKNILFFITLLFLMAFMMPMTSHAASKVTAPKSVTMVAGDTESICVTTFNSKLKLKATSNTSKLKITSMT